MVEILLSQDRGSFSTSRAFSIIAVNFLLNQVVYAYKKILSYQRPTNITTVMSDGETTEYNKRIEEEEQDENIEEQKTHNRIF